MLSYLFIYFSQVSFLLLITPITHNYLATACFIKPAKVAPTANVPINLKNYPRNISQTRKCVCGWNNPANPLFNPWIVFIHHRLPSSKVRICPGTIINSNMIITSHKCLQRKDRINILDVWKPSQPSDSTLADPKEVAVEVARSYLNPKRIIYSERYAHDNIQGMKASDSDVAILVMDKNFTPIYEQALVPICLPKFGEIKTEKLINVVGYYQGIRSWDFYPKKGPIGLFNYTTIGRAEECKQLGKLKVEPPSRDTLCMRFQQPGPTTEGGPLRINSRYIDGITQRSFLVGLATWVESELEADARHKYAYFANVNSFVKYIERHAVAQKSEWCTTPKFSDDDEDWPWEREAKYVPDKSLDCGCGTKTAKNMGRVSGGETAVPREFPWMVKLTILSQYQLENGTIVQYNGSCGGTVINDRVIMTAAHCLLNPYKGAPYDNAPVLEFPFDLKAAYLANVNSHFLDNDDKEVLAPLEHIYIHPGYIGSILTNGIYDFDIALAILAKPLNLTQFPPICLPREGELAEVIRQKLYGTVAGWGLTNFGDHNSQAKELQKIELPIHSIFNCTGFGNENPVGTKICVGNFGTEKSAQQGDSGGPIMVKNKEGIMTQFGIVSYYSLKPDETGKPTSDAGIITYQTNVEAFLPYIYFYSERHGARGCRREPKKDSF